MWWAGPGRKDVVPPAHKSTDAGGRYRLHLALSSVLLVRNGSDALGCWRYRLDSEVQ